MKFLYLSLVLLFTYSFAHSQTVYKFAYHVDHEATGKTDHYKALLVRFDDGTGYVRVRFTDSKGNAGALAAMELEEEEETLKSEVRGGKDTTYLLLQGTNPRIVRGNPAEKYKMDAFGFYLDSEDYYVPWIILKGDIMNDENNVDLGEYDEADLLEEKDLTEELVLEFFNRDEPFYKQLFANVVKPITPDNLGTTMHLLLVADTQDEEIGATCEKDRVRVSKNYRELATFMGIGFKETTISGASYSKANVDAAIKAIQPAPKDIVVFYYTGHGFSNPSDQYTYPHLVLRSASFQPLEPNSLAMEEIYRAIVAKGARLNLVMSDCCNSDPRAIGPVMEETAKTRSSGVGWDKNTCISLFMPAKPTNILMTAAAKGQLAAGNVSYGGFFSYNFKASLDRFLSPLNSFGGVSWEQVVKEAAVQTVEKANRSKCDIPTVGVRPCVQNPVYKVEYRH